MPLILNTYVMVIFIRDFAVFIIFPEICSGITLIENVTRVNVRLFGTLNVENGDPFQRSYF
jgi:hypothetical protein